MNKALLTDQLLGLESSHERYSAVLVSDTPRFAYGNRLSFNDRVFLSYYTAPCGNGYFIQLRGTYRILTGNILEINI